KIWGMPIPFPMSSPRRYISPSCPCCLPNVAEPWRCIRRKTASPCVFWALLQIVKAFETRTCRGRCATKADAGFARSTLTEDEPIADFLGRAGQCFKMFVLRPRQELIRRSGHAQGPGKPVASVKYRNAECRQTNDEIIGRQFPTPRPDLIRCLFQRLGIGLTIGGAVREALLQGQSAFLFAEMGK